MCAQLHVFRSADYLKFLMGLGKLFTKKCAQLHVLFAVETIWSFWGELESFDKKGVTSYTFCSQYRLFQVFDGTWKNFHKKSAQLHVLFAVETISSFGWHLENFPQIYMPSYTFFRSADYLKFLMGLGKLFTKKCPVTRFVLCGDYLKNFHKKCAQLQILFAVETILSFGWDLEKYQQKCVPSYTFCSLWRLF